jgi:hypothetical protein
MQQLRGKFAFGKMIFPTGKPFSGRVRTLAGGKAVVTAGKSSYCRERRVLVSKRFYCRENGFIRQENGFHTGKRFYRQKKGFTGM